MCHVSTQGVDERMISVHYYYYCCCLKFLYFCFRFPKKRCHSKILEPMPMLGKVDYCPSLSVHMILLPCFVPGTKIVVIVFELCHCHLERAAPGEQGTWRQRETIRKGGVCVF